MNEQTTVTFPAIELRVPDIDERIVEGIVVPWNETSFMTPDPKGERFLPGSMTRTVREKGARTKLFRNHDHTRALGTSIRWDARDDRGLFGQFRIGQVPGGDELLDEVREGLLDAFSIGFQPIRVQRAADGAREVLEARLAEASLCPIGAYDGAQVLAVRAPAAFQVPEMPAVNLDPIPPIRYMQ
jgi:uncharacterized protein